MRTTQQFSITLPLDTAEVVEAKIKSGGYASVSEVVRDGVRALMERDEAAECWLREDVVAGHQEYLADPSKGGSGQRGVRPHQGPPRRAKGAVNVCAGHFHTTCRTTH
jgi:antitoxin ParD1/3/4